MTKGSVLVVGTRKGSLGEDVRIHLRERGWDVVTAGIDEGEDIHCNLTRGVDVDELMGRPWDHVVCTVGMNHPLSIRDEAFMFSLDRQLMVNTLGPLTLLSNWCKFWGAHFGKMQFGAEDAEPVRHFVAISSNSASIARTKSVGYCASKAALSMGIRCAAREMASYPMAIYAYEPGWLNGTPMSKEVAARLPVGTAHRIPSGEGIDPFTLAALIAHNIDRDSSRALNGCILRIDGGEQ